MIKVSPWDYHNLTGVWKVTLKIDGVRALWNGKHWVSRANINLNNMPAYAGYDDVEVFCGSFKETIQKITTLKNRPINPDELFSLNPLDTRLDLLELTNPTSTEITALLEKVVKEGFEGLVLRQGDNWIKVKPIETYDVVVTGIIPGKGRHKDRMGALVTSMGKVGTGFSDKERSYDYLGKTIEVSCLSVTPAGKFRHPRFIRVRPDKG